MNLALDDRVVQAIYRAAAGLLPWKTALGGINRAMAGVGLQLVVVDKARGLLVHSEQPWDELLPIAIDATLDHVREYHRHDPHLARAMSLPVGEVMHTAEAFPREQFADHPFYRDFWAAYGVGSLLAVKILDNATHRVGLGLSRMVWQPTYSAEEIDLFRRYAEHLACAFGIAESFGEARADGGAGKLIMEASPRPMFLLDATGRVIRRNDAAAKWLQAKVPLREVEGLLCGANPQAAEQFASALGELRMRLMAPDADAQALPQRQALRLAGDRGPGLVGSLWTLPARATMGVFGLQPTLLLTIPAPQVPGHADAMLLGSMFDLTPAEVQVALALLQGQSVKDIAAQRQTAVYTVRSQLRSLFDKTDTRRQAELVNLVARVTLA